MKIPEDHNKINKNNQDKKSMTIPFILPIIIESLFEKYSHAIMKNHLHQI